MAPVQNGIPLRKLRLTLKSRYQFSRVALRFLETRSDALDSTMPASLVHISEALDEYCFWQIQTGAHNRKTLELLTFV